MKPGGRCPCCGGKLTTCLTCEDAVIRELREQCELLQRVLDSTRAERDAAEAKLVRESNDAYLAGRVDALEEAEGALCRLMLQVYGSEDRAAQRAALSDAIQVVRQSRNKSHADRSAGAEGVHS